MASTENKEEELVIDPRIIGVFRQVTFRAMGEITKRLVEQGLLDEELEQAQPPLTLEWLGALIRGEFLAFSSAFSEAEVVLSPKGREVDHIGLSDGILKGLGQPEVRLNLGPDITGINNIEIRFTGEKPIVKNFTVRWDEERYSETPHGPEKTVTCNVTFGERMKISPGNVTDRGNQTLGSFPRLGQRRHSND